MTAPTIGTNVAQQYNSAGGSKNYSVSPTGAEGLVVMMTERTNGAGSGWSGTAPVYGGVTVPLAADSGAQGNHSRTAIWFLDDLSSVSGSTLTVVVPSGPAMCIVWYGLIQHGGIVALLDDGGGTTSVALATGAVDGLVMAAGTGGAEITAGGNAANLLWDADFFGPYHSEGGYGTLTGSGSATMASAAAMSAIVIGGAEVLVTFPSLDVEVVIDGLTIIAPSDVVIPYAGFTIGVYFEAGYTMEAVGPKQVRLVDLNGIETPIETTGGTEGQVLTYHEDQPPDWQDAAAGASALDDLTDVDAPAPTDGQALVWDDYAGEWVAGDVDVDLDGYVIGYWQTGDPGTPPQDEAIWFDEDDAGGSSYTDPSGTSFPSSPATNQRFWRTDIKGGMGFHYDGTRWVSDVLYSTPFIAFSQSAQNFYGGTSFDAAGMDVWVVQVDLVMAVETTNNGSNYWRMDLYNSAIGASLGGSNLMASATSTAAMTAGVAADRSFTVGQVLDVNVNPALQAYFGKPAGAPGNVRAFGAILWRYIAT